MNSTLHCFYRAIRSAVTLSMVCASINVALADRVYQWTDPTGAVVFSDAPPEDGSARHLRTIQMQPATVVPAYKPVQRLPAASQPEVKRAPYRSFALTRPESNEAIRKNSGDVFVESQVEPGLRPGDVIRVYIDGKQVAEKTSTSFDLTNIDRGDHTLEARIYDDRGIALASAQPVRFSVIRTSVLHNSFGETAIQPRAKITNPIIYGAD